MSRILTRMIILLAMIGLAGPVLAADDYKFSLYGSARITTFYSDYDQADDSDFVLDKQGNSRFGMKAGKGAVSGHYEAGLKSNVVTRLMYGTYRFDGGALVIGQDWTPYTFLAKQASSSDQNLNGYGTAFDDRLPQIRLDFDNGITLAAIKNNGQGDANDTDLPKLAIGYKGKSGAFSYGLNLAYQSYEVEASGFDADSYMATFNGIVNLSPMAIQFNLAYGQNPVEFGLTDTDFGEDVAATENEDTAYLGGYVMLSYRADDSNTIRVGVGYVEEDNDDYAQKEKRISYYIHDQYSIAPGFFIVPEFAIYDGLDDADGSDGEQSYTIGAKWQVNF